MSEPHERPSLQQLAAMGGGIATQQHGNVSKGIPCPVCGCTRRRVWRTEPDVGVIKRETICLQCESKQVTYERP